MVFTLPFTCNSFQTDFQTIIPNFKPPFKMELSHMAISVLYQSNSSPASWQFTTLKAMIWVLPEQFNFHSLEATGPSNIRVSPAQCHLAPPTNGQGILSKSLQAMRAGEQLCSLQVAWEQVLWMSNKPQLTACEEAASACINSLRGLFKRQESKGGVSFMLWFHVLH